MGAVVVSFPRAEAVGKSTSLTDDSKSSRSSSQRTAKIQEPQPENTGEEGLEAAALRQEELDRVEGVNGFPDPEESLLLRIFQIPTGESEADAIPG
jgi:hypothetical protein